MSAFDDAMRKRLHEHPQYDNLLRRVAAAYGSSGKYGARWRRYQKSTLYHIGDPYHVPFKFAYGQRLHSAFGVADRMIDELFTEQRWPDRGDMAAYLINLVHNDVDARRAV